MPEDEDAWRRWLAAVVDPRTGAIVQGGGRLRVDRWDMGTRTLPVHMLHFVLAGGHGGRVGDATVTTERDAILWVPAGVRQELRSGPKRPFAMFYLRFALDASPPPSEPYVRHRVPDAYPLFARLIAELAAARRSSVAMRALLALIFVEWQRAGAAAEGGLSAAQQARIIAEVDRRCDARPSPAWLAAKVGLSPDAFARRFSRTFGLPPRAWLVQRRIALAAQRLQEKADPIGDIAAEFGYADLYLFSRQFKRTLGVSPSRWRGCIR